MGNAALLREMMARMPDYYRAGGFSSETSFYFKLGEEPGERWTIFCGPEAARAVEGKQTDRADCVLSTNSQFFLKMFQENYTPGVRDFLKGRIKTNDPQLLLKFKDAFEIPEELR